MKLLVFNDNMFHYYHKYVELNNYDFHINENDFPMMHGHADYWEFTILTRGKLINVLNGKEYVYGPNTVFYATTEDVHCLRRVTEEPLRYINIAVRRDTIQQLLNTLSPSYVEQLKHEKHAYIFQEDFLYRIEKIIYNANSLVSNQTEERNRLLGAAVLLLLHEILYQRFTAYDNDDSMPEGSHWLHKLHMLVQSIDFPYYTVKDLCNKLGYSRMQLNRLFHTHFGQTPIDYLTDCKMHHAKNLLKNTDMKIINIAEASGYASVTQFQKNFKKKYGVSPTQYRKKS